MNIFKKINIFCLLFLLLGNILLTKSEEEACKNATITINEFWNKLKNIQHGNVIYINLKNYYCPACNIYTPIWNSLQEQIQEIENDNVSFFTFDCACSILLPYCVSFDVEYYPTFRILYPVYEKDPKNKNNKYINPLDVIGGELYEGTLTLAYQEMRRADNAYSLQKMIKEKLCSNSFFNNVNLKSCLTSPIKEMEEDTIVLDSDTHAKKHLRVEKWHAVANREYIEHDIILGLLYVLKNNIFNGKEVKYNNVETLLTMLEVVSNMYPHLSEDINSIITTLKGVTYPINYVDWQELTINFKIKNYQIENKLNFKICEQNMLLCSFWILYHKISVYSLLHDSKNYAFYKDLIVDYTKKYLKCQQCVKHFLNVNKKCYFGSCNIKSPENLVIFLWRLHNSVTLRTICESVANDLKKSSKATSLKSKFLHVDVAFPSEKACKKCRTGNGLTFISLNMVNNYKKKLYSDEHFDAIDAFNINYVLQYLIGYYS